MIMMDVRLYVQLRQTGIVTRQWNLIYATFVEIMFENPQKLVMTVIWLMEGDVHLTVSLS